jgi:hypothetical protein
MCLEKDRSCGGGHLRSIGVRLAKGPGGTIQEDGPGGQAWGSVILPVQGRNTLPGAYREEIK